jgi:GNAT superfamily N-acetyltransferase
MAEMFHGETRYPTSFNDGRVEALVSRMIGTSSAVIFVAGEPACGFLAAFKDVSPMTGEHFANEIAFWVDPSHRRGKYGAALIDAYVDWAKSNGCAVARLTTQENMRPELVERVYGRFGFGKQETAFIRRL